MQSKISLYKSEMSKHIGRNVGWLSILYFITLVFCLPLDILMTATNENRGFWEKVNLFQINQDIQYILFIAAPVLIALFLYRFLHVKESTDLFHSLPVKREQIYHQYTLTGWAYLNVPVLVVAIFVFIEHRAFDLDLYFSVGDIWYWAGLTILFNTIIYISAVFVGMFTGLSMLHGVLAYIFLLLPVGLIVLISFNLRFFLYGFSDYYFANDKMRFLSPLIILERLSHLPIEMSFVIGYLVISIVLYVLALFVYKKRKSEAVSQAIVFPMLKPVFIMGTTLCTAFLGALYFGETQNHSTFWLVFGYITGSIIGYLAAQMVLHKTWRIIDTFKKFPIYAGILLITVALFKFDVFGYETRLPDLKEVTKVHLSNSPHLLMYEDDLNKPFYLKTEENIKLTHQLHEEIVENRNQKEEWVIGDENVEDVFFAYELKNGKRFVREYRIDKSKYKQYFHSIHESKEYKEVTNPLFKVKEEELKFITINPRGPLNRNAVISESNDMKEFIRILKEDIFASTYDEMYNEKGFQSSIGFVLGKDSIDIPLRPSYVNVLNWLKQEGLYEKATVSVEDLEYAYVVKKGQLQQEDLRILDMDPGQFFKEYANASNSLKFTSKDEVKILMEISREQYIFDANIQYIVAFKFKNYDYPVVYSFATKEVPTFISSQLK
ncbi:DUF6449 domain-containing protein [Bacillus sp. 31A1R]|uniref:DUF6449 domain-containing protein n=1 Tax=Robertmurraya mangrovi TaxID=3098077 RepID=A0ABU5IWJ6_9BACI|nr:DUF6449 domain-containing protein [Bacillus sp. 31A1R]MDZ5471519.1 DUF6449 domain-containing protein [Bacillus sp. 31A1R]